MTRPLDEILAIDTIRTNLLPVEQTIECSDQTSRAAVAMLLQGDPATDIFFILRAQHDNDPWSGDIGFPGGKIEARESAREAVERETLEEIGVDLTQGFSLGALEPIRGAHLPVVIHCLVYQLMQRPAINCNHEISSFFWSTVNELLVADRFGNYEVRFRHERFLRPGIQILPQGQPILWGITYRLLEQFFSRSGVPFPPNAL